MKSSYRVIAFLVCVSLILCGTAFAQSPEVDAGLGYLVATQNGDGSWGTTPTATTTDFIATSSALSALAAWGYTQAASYQNGLAWLSTECASDDSTSHISATYLAQGIEVLATSGADTSFYVTSLLDMGTGTAWGGYAEYDPSPYHTALAMFALRSAGYEDATLLSYNLGYVLAGQGADGGWGWSAGDETSSALVTAYVLRALSPYAYTYTEVATSVGKGVAYLLSHQNADGGFGSSPSTVPETALGLIALNDSSEARSYLAEALTYLTEGQGTDGSWNDSTYLTASALAALSFGRPNLILSSEEISFSDLSPLSGDEITVSVVINNDGLSNADKVRVRFYEGEPSSGNALGSDILIDWIAAGGSQSATVSHDTSGLSGRSNVYVVVDPDDEISETAENDNEAWATVTIDKPIDLRVHLSLDGYYPEQIAPNMDYSIRGYIIVTGEDAARDITVGLFDGQGTEIERVTVSEAKPYQWVPIEFSGLQNSALGTYSYSIIVDPDGNLPDTDRTNNSANIEVNVKDLSATNDDLCDYYVAESGITFSPSLPVAGQSVKIIIQLSSTCSRSYEGYLYVYHGDPSNGGEKIGEPGYSRYGGTYHYPFTAFNWTMVSGVPDIYVVFDPKGLIAETDETNNIAHRAIPTYASDLSVSEKQISFDPVLPEEGQDVSLNIEVKNLGGIEAGASVRVSHISEDGTTTDIGVVPVTVVGGTSETVSLPFAYMDGELRVSLEEISPDDIVESNNAASATYGESIPKQSTNEGREFWIIRPAYDPAPTGGAPGSITIQSDRLARVYVTGSMTWNGTVEPGSPKKLLVSDINAPVRILSDENVSVVVKTYEGVFMNEDAYLAIPVSSLGTEHYVMNYADHGWPYHAAHITVIAAYDNTNIDIEGQTLNLDTGGLWYYYTTKDPTGWRVRSDKPVNVVSGRIIAYIPYNCAHAGNPIHEQLLPTSLLETAYDTAPLYSPSGSDVVRVLATEDGTDVSLEENGIVKTSLLNRSEFKEYDVEFASSIVATKPIAVAQYAMCYSLVGGGDPFQMTIIPKGLFKTHYRFYIFEGYDQANGASVIAPDQQTSILIDGIPYEGEWSSLPNGGKYASIQLSEGEHVIDSDKPIAVYVHGYDPASSYGYPAGFGIPLPDLTVSDLAIDPENPISGQKVLVSFTLANEGGLEGRDIRVSLYDGDPASGGIEVAYENVDVVEPFQSIPMALTWDSTGYPSHNNLYVIADSIQGQEEASEDNNTTLITVDLSEPALPDLELKSMALSAESVREGNDLTLTVTIRNRGSDVTLPPINVYIDSELVESRTVGRRLAEEEECPESFVIGTTGRSGSHELSVVLDPEDAVDESNEVNNSYKVYVTVLGAVITTSGETDAATYGANADVIVTSLSASTSPLPIDLQTRVTIEDADGNIVDTLDGNDLTLFANALDGWHYGLVASVSADSSSDIAIATMEINFAAELSALGKDGSAVDRNSIRVIEVGPGGYVIGEMPVSVNFTSDATAALEWTLVNGIDTGETRTFHVYFDIEENGNKETASYPAIPRKNRVVGFLSMSSYVHTIDSYPDGTFGAPTYLGILIRGGARSIAMRDFNRDGHVDFLLSQDGGRSGTYRLLYYQNRADGSDTYIEPTALFTSTADEWDRTWKAAVGDYNNDGYDDMLDIASNRKAKLYLNNGNGTFEMIDYSFGSGSTNGVLVPADYNRDGNLDLLVSDASGYLSMYRGVGDGTFYLQEASIQTLGYAHHFFASVAGDFDNDGLVDLISVNTAWWSTNFYKGNEKGSFDSGVSVSTLPFTYLASWAAGGDLNGDGNQDLLCFNGYNFNLYPGMGDGTFGSPTFMADVTYWGGIAGIGPSVGINEAVSGAAASISAVNDFSWNTGILQPGSYWIHVEYLADEELYSEYRLRFEIVADGGIDAGVSVDRVQYDPGATAKLTARLLNESTNTTFEGLSTTTLIEGPTGEVVTDEAGTISLLTPGQVVDQASYWQTSGAAPGIYTARFTVLDGSAELASDETTFEVLGTAVTGEGLTGTLALDPARVSPGEEASYAASVTNAGNEDVAAATISVLLVDPASGAALQTYEELHDLATGATVSVSGALSTAGLTINETYLVVLRVSTTSMSEAKTLASATLAVVDTTPPVVTLTAPVSGSLWNGPVAIAATATDDASGVNAVEYRIDSGAWSAMSASGSGYTATWTPTASDEGSRTISVRATDNAGNASEPVSVGVTVDLTPPSPPVITSPAEGSVLVVRDLTIEGTAEVGAWVTLTGPSLTTTIMNDGFEDFALEGIALDPGENMFRFTATDAAGNVSEEAVLTISYVPIEMSIEMPADLTNVLLWINTGCTSSAEKGCANLDTVLAVAEELFTGARIVYDKKDFQSELENPYYTDFVILGDGEPMEDHYAAQLRERVYAGAGLVSSLFTREVLDESAFGIKQAGRLAGSAFTVSLGGDAPAWSGAYAVAGDALKVASEGATEAGWFELVSKKGEVEYAPAVLANGYGLGRAMVFAFAVEEQGADVMRALLGAAVEYVHRVPVEGEAYPASGMAAIRAMLTTEGGEIGVRYTLEFPEGLTLYDALAGAWLDASPYTLDTTIEKGAPGEAVLYVLLPEDGGAFTLTSSVGYVAGEVYTEVATDERELTVVARDVLVERILDELAALAVEPEEAEWVAEAVATMEGVRLRGDGSQEARDEDARDTLHAVEMVRKVGSADASDALLLMDALLRSYAGAAYYGR